MKSLPFSLALLVSIGCKPTNASVTDGEFTAFLATSTSRTLNEEELDVDAFAEHWQVDCRPDVADEDRLEGALDICSDFSPSHELWTLLDAYEVVKEPLAPWRGEAILTSEGDLQITFHHSLPGFGQDFRFAFIVNPEFQPTECVLDDSGNTVAADINGNWIDNWSADAGEGSLFYLNAGSYQFNPADLDDAPWVLPDEWLAGFATSKFSVEDMPLRPARYGYPAAYSSFELDETPLTADDLFYVAMADGADPAADADFQELITDVVGTEEQPGVLGEVVDELATVGVEAEPRIHTNEWRTPDGNSPGLDGWVELHYNWVHFDQAPADLVAGNAASGEFHLVFDATESQSRVFVKGSFDVSEIQEDRYTTPDLREVKLEEAGTELCD
jgi:hypothetical protein